MELDDRDRAERIRGGSGAAFEALMKRYQRLGCRIAYGFTGERESALDVSQNVFLKVHSRLASWRAEGELKSWIARIAANEALNWRRREARNQDWVGEEQPQVALVWPQEDEVRERERRELIQRSVEELNPRQRLAIVLRFFHGMSSQEIAEVLHCSDGTARNLLFRSLRKLRDILSPMKEVLP